MLKNNGTQSLEQNTGSWDVYFVIQSREKSP